MTRTRVLLVDDSLTVRRRLAEALATEADIEIAGEASDGRSAIDLCRDLRPDVVTMDMVLPRLSGLEATEEIMAFHPTPILVVSASINRGDLFKTYDALAAGAVDVLDKPSGVEDDAAWDRAFREAVRRVARVRVITHPRAKLDALRRPAEPKIPRTPPPVAKPRSEARVVDPTRLKRPRRVAADVVAVGASTGGPAALRTFLRGLPPDFATPVVLVLHIAPLFAAGLADWLAGQSKIRVAFAVDGARVRAGGPGVAWLAPPDRHLVIVDGTFRLVDRPPRHSCRPAVDELFASVATAYGSRAIGCLLTGMGRDGAVGLLKMREAGALTIAESETTAVVYGMPREAVEIGAAELVLPIEEIAPTVAAAAEGDVAPERKEPS